MAKDHALRMLMICNIYLPMASNGIKDALYIVIWAYKGSEGEGVCLNWQPDIVEATSPVKNKKGEQRSRSNISCEEQERKTES
jgi:hypothetical protein